MNHLEHKDVELCDEKEFDVDLSNETDHLLNVQVTQHEASSKLPSFMFFIQGFGMLLPWNIFITANEYFRYKFQSDPSLKVEFENGFSVASQVSCVIGSLLTMYFTGRVSRNKRVILSLSLITISFVTAAIFVHVDTGTWTYEFYIINIILIIVINFCSGIFQLTLFGIAGVVGPQYIHSILVGISVGGIGASLINLLSLIVTSSIKLSGVLYFSLAFAVAIVCLFSYITLSRMPLVKNKLYFPKEIEKSNPSNTDNNIQVKVGGGKDIRFILKVIYPKALSVFFLFFVTISLQPAVISNIHSVYEANKSNWTNKYFSALVCFLLFNSGDISGRLVAGSCRIFKTDSRLLPLLCISRITFMPLFALCNYQPRSHLPVIFNADVYTVIFNAIFSFTNGYFTAMCMMYGAQLVENQYKELAGVIMQVSLALGTSAGAALSYAIIACI